MSIISKSSLLSWRNSNRETRKSVTDSLNEWRAETRYGRVTIFLSHKHNETSELDAAISLLRGFGVDIYVDWQDGGMPKSTSGETAKRIKTKISACKKFIFLATEGAIESKWCNWELGHGDSLKYMDHIALFPVRESDYASYSGSEYMNIYSSIEYLDGSSKTVGGDPIDKGWYVMEPADENGNRKFRTLRRWLLL